MASAIVQYKDYDDQVDQEDQERWSSSSPEPDSDSGEHNCHNEQRRVSILDPSEHFRPDTHGKGLDEFRRYTEEEEDYIQQRVKRTYYQMHKNQSVDFVRGRMSKWMKFNHAELTIMEALELLNSLLDESDPDSDLPNIVHAFQTAERIRATHPDQDWFHLTGLIHDLGKVMALWGEEQWAVVGDTFLVGCAYGDSIVYRQNSFDENPDLKNPRYNSKYGIYQPNCGLDNVIFSWGHDEYMARVLQNHKRCTLPAEAIKIIKLHSFYPWHTGGDYMHLCTQEDIEKTMPLIREFNNFDLYTKSAPVPDIEALLPYYQGLIDKYIPGKVKWWARSLIDWSTRLRLRLFRLMWWKSNRLNRWNVAICEGDNNSAQNANVNFVQTYENMHLDR